MHPEEPEPYELEFWGALRAQNHKTVSLDAFSICFDVTNSKDRLRFVSGRVTARAEDAQGTPGQNHISPSILAHEMKSFLSATGHSKCATYEAYRGTSSMEKRLPVRPYRTAIHRALWWS